MSEYGLRYTEKNDSSRSGVLTTDVPDPSPMYISEVELAIEAPVDLSLASKLYVLLQTVPELRIVQTLGSVRKGVVITVVLAKPTGIGEIIASKLPGVKTVLRRQPASISNKGAAPTKTTLVLKQS